MVTLLGLLLREAIDEHHLHFDPTVVRVAARTSPLRRASETESSTLPLSR
jgi:hypothetical protein